VYELLTYLRSDKGAEFILHHLAVITTYGLVLYCGEMHFWAAWAGTVEATNPSLCILQLGLLSGIGARPLRPAARCLRPPYAGTHTTWLLSLGRIYIRSPFLDGLFFWPRTYEGQGMSFPFDIFSLVLMTPLPSTPSSSAPAPRPNSGFPRASAACVDLISRPLPPLPLAVRRPWLAP